MSYCSNIISDSGYHLSSVPINETALLVFVYLAVIAIGALIAAHAHRLYCIVRMQQYLIQEKIPPAINDADVVGKATAYRNTRLTGITQGLDGGGMPNDVPPGLFLVGGADDDSVKDQITRIEEKMVPVEARKIVEKDKSLGLKKEVSGPRSVFL